jgi:deoxyribodipyrimidine photo-lyase
MTTLYWFRNDLRLHDNEAIQWLCQNADHALFVYSFPLNFSRAGKFRRKFQLETLLDLQTQLQERGHHLYISYSHPEEVIPQLVTKYKIDTLLYTLEHTTEEILEEQQVLSRTLVKHVQAFDQRSLIKKMQLPFSLKDMPLHFSEFRNALEHTVKVFDAVDIPALWPRSINVDEFELDLHRELHMFTTPSRFIGGENHALHRLYEFIWEKDLLRHHKDLRSNHLHFDDSSKFSAWLANGSLSPRFIFSQIKKYEHERAKNDSTAWMISELLLRDYFKFYTLKFGAKIFRHQGVASSHENLPLNDSLQQELFKSWRTGTTGVELIDANIKELNETGYMSNRGRQIVASYLAKTLGVDWRKGARYFEEMLIDYDPTNNWGNWNYAAGVGADNSEFNLEKQIQNFDPEGQYVRRWLGSNHQGSHL